MCRSGSGSQDSTLSRSDKFQKTRVSLEKQSKRALHLGRRRARKTGCHFHTGKLTSRTRSTAASERQPCWRGQTACHLQSTSKHALVALNLLRERTTAVTLARVTLRRLLSLEIIPSDASDHRVGAEPCVFGDDDFSHPSDHTTMELRLPDETFG